MPITYDAKANTDKPSNRDLRTAIAADDFGLLREFAQRLKAAFLLKLLDDRNIAVANAHQFGEAADYTDGEGREAYREIASRYWGEVNRVEKSIKTHLDNKFPV